MRLAYTDDGGDVRVAELTPAGRLLSDRIVERGSINHQDPVGYAAVAWSPHGRYLLFAGGSGVGYVVYDAAANKVTSPAGGKHDIGEAQAATINDAGAVTVLTNSTTGTMPLQLSTYTSAARRTGGQSRLSYDGRQLVLGTLSASTIDVTIPYQPTSPGLFLLGDFTSVHRHTTVLYAVNAATDAVTHVGSVSGGPVEMAAVSPDQTKAAVLVDTQTPCHGAPFAETAQRLVLVNLRTGAVTTPRGTAGLTFQTDGHLKWSTTAMTAVLDTCTPKAVAHAYRLDGTTLTDQGRGTTLDPGPDHLTARTTGTEHHTTFSLTGPHGPVSPGLSVKDPGPVLWTSVG